jgi:hypothetical protein
MNTFHPLAHPEIGNHSLPDNPLEVEAALRAGQYSWQICPYYTLRYAERGERFTRSDSGYLVTLTQQDSETVQKQVDWLADVLANRGMPTWLLEQHLRVLYKELCMVLPENSLLYEKLLVAAEAMTARRTHRISEAKTAELVADFQKSVAIDEWATHLPEAGMLVVTAVADEANHIEQAVPSLISWLTSSERFSMTWKLAIGATLAKAREAVRHD